MELEGGCYCGGLRYQLTGDAMFKGQCHCRECQYFSGGSVNVIMAVAEAGFAYSKGAPKSFTRSDLDNPVTREFCPDCGTHHYTPLGLHNYTGTRYNGISDTFLREQRNRGCL